jgi:hypothetical protein
VQRKDAAALPWPALKPVDRSKDGEGEAEAVEPMDGSRLADVALLSVRDKIRLYRNKEHT